MRVLFTAQDLQTIRDAFGRAKPNTEYSRLYAAAVARRQADQIYNLSLTRTATVILGQGARRVIGVGRVNRRSRSYSGIFPLAHFASSARPVSGSRIRLSSSNDGRSMLHSRRV